MGFFQWLRPSKDETWVPGANALLERFLGADGNFSLDSLVTLPYSQAAHRFFRPFSAEHV